MPVRHGILALLAEEPRHGYQLKTEFERRTGGAWPLNVGQVYTTLDRLERDGLVAPAARPGGDRNQRTWKITAAGRQEMKAWYQSTPAEDGPPRDELMVKVLLALGRGRREALAAIDAQRAALFSVLQSHRRAQPSRSNGSDPAADLVHDAVAVRLEADLRWLDRCEARIQEDR